MATIIQILAVVLVCAIACCGLEAVPSTPTPLFILKRGVQVMLVIGALYWCFGLGRHAQAACSAPVAQCALR